MSLAYVDLGAPDAPPIVLLHALGESADDWAVVADRLLREGWRLVALDLRGHGGSDQPGEYSFGAMTTDVTAALDRLWLHDVVLVGHSMGGNVAPGGRHAAGPRGAPGRRGQLPAVRP